jgi:SAM-dependent methyltransferase
MKDVESATRGVYERQAAVWDATRARTLLERRWIDRALDLVPPGAPVLDLGCGAGEPIAAYLIFRGHSVCGVDFAAPMLALARARFPDQDWVLADMRTLDLGRRFGAIIGWDSFFHLTADDQRAVIPRLAAHLAPGGALLLTVGPDAGEALGSVGGETLYHASLSPAEYSERLGAVGVEVVDFAANDPDCAGHSVLLGRAGDLPGTTDR